SIPYLQIAQNKKSERVLYAIIDFMKTIPLGFNQTKNISPPMGYSFINKKTNVISCVWSDIDSLHDYVVPFFSNLTFYSRKKVDFHNWTIIVKMYKFGYYVLPKGKAVLLKIISSSNKSRYSSNLNFSSIDPNLISSLRELFSINP